MRLISHLITKTMIPYLIQIELRENKSKYPNQTISRPNLNKIPETLLQRDSYLDLQRFASEQEKNNYESTRKGVNFSEQNAMNYESNTFDDVERLLDNKYRVQQPGEMTIDNRMMKAYEFSKPQIMNEKQTPLSSARRKIDLGGDTTKKGIPSTVLNLHTPKKGDIVNSVDRRLTKRNNLMSSSQEFNTPLQSKFLGDPQQSK